MISVSKSIFILGYKNIAKNQLFIVLICNGADDICPAEPSSGENYPQW